MINMKKKILLSVLLIIAYTVISYAQTPKDFDKEVIKYSTIVKWDRDKVINGDLENLFKVMKKENVEFKSYYVTFTSPWTEESRGKAYVDEIHFAIVNIYDLDDNTPYHRFVVKINDRIEYNDFIKMCSDKPLTILGHFSKVKVKDFRYKIGRT
jgi:hypothetical protein